MQCSTTAQAATPLQRSAKVSFPTGLVGMAKVRLVGLFFPVRSASLEMASATARQLCGRRKTLKGSFSKVLVLLPTVLFLSAAIPRTSDRMMRGKGPGLVQVSPTEPRASLDDSTESAAGTKSHSGWLRVLPGLSVLDGTLVVKGLDDSVNEVTLSVVVGGIQRTITQFDSRQLAPGEQFEIPLSLLPNGSESALVWSSGRTSAGILHESHDQYEFVSAVDDWDTTLLFPRLFDALPLQQLILFNVGQTAMKAGTFVASTNVEIASCSVAQAPCPRLLGRSPGTEPRACTET